MSTGLSLDATPAEQQAASSSSVPIKRRKARPSPAAPEVRPLPQQQPAATMMEDEPVHVRTMADLARDFPHIRMDSQCEQAATKLAAANEMLAPGGGKRAHDPLDPRTIAAAAAAAAADLSSHKKDLDQVQSRSIHFSASQSDPLEFTLMQRARDKLVMPERRIADVLHTHKDASAILRSSATPLLPLYTAPHETNLLRFHAGTFNLPGYGERTFPPCCYGIHCKGRSPNEIPGLTEPITLTRAMSPEELIALLQHNTQPVGLMPCVLCGRFYLVHAVLLQRHGLRPALQQSLLLQEPDSVLQLWRNLDNEPGGYFRRYVFHALPDEVVIDPIANYHPSLLHATYNPKLLAWTIHQDQMIWRPAALLPRDVVGESVQGF